jgi:hypothetical protein
MSESAHFDFNAQKVDMPIKEGTIGPSVVDIGKLYGQINRKLRVQNHLY